MSDFENDPHIMRDRGRETSNALVRVRTTLTTATTNLHALRHNVESWRDPNVSWDSANGETWTEWLDRAYINYYDEDIAEMIDALETVVEALSWWKRTGR